MAGRGRPPKLTPEARTHLCRYIKMGGTDKDAAAAAGIEYATLRLWLLRGEREGSGDYFDFFEEYTRAKNLRKMTWLEHVNLASLRDWNAAKWLLAVHHPEQFSQSAQDVAALLEKILRRVSPQAAAEVLVAMAAGSDDGDGDTEAAGSG